MLTTVLGTREDQVRADHSLTLPIFWVVAEVSPVSSPTPLKPSEECTLKSILSKAELSRESRVHSWQGAESWDGVGAPSVIPGQSLSFPISSCEPHSSS